MINAYEKKGLVDKCEKLYDEMKKQGIEPDIVTWYLLYFINLFIK